MNNSDETLEENVEYIIEEEFEVESQGDTKMIIPNTPASHSYRPYRNASPKTDTAPV